MMKIEGASVVLQNIYPYWLKHAMLLGIPEASEWEDLFKK
jgi:hypothetical protein